MLRVHVSACAGASWVPHSAITFLNGCFNGNFSMQRRYPLKAGSRAMLEVDLAGRGWLPKLRAAGFDPQARPFSLDACKASASRAPNAQEVATLTRVITGELAAFGRAWQRLQALTLSRWPNRQSAR